MESQCPIMNKLGDAQALGWGEGLNARLEGLPVDVVECLVGPFCSAVAKSVVRAVFGVFDEILFVGFCSDIFFRVFRDRAALVVE